MTATKNPENALSSVIGVILMATIIMILAAVIATFVFSMVDTTGNILTTNESVQSGCEVFRLSSWPSPSHKIVISCYGKEPKWQIWSDENLAPVSNYLVGNKITVTISNPDTTNIRVYNYNYGDVLNEPPVFEKLV